MCNIFVCPDSGVVATGENVNVHTDADAVDCTGGLCGHPERVHWKLTLGEKSLAAPGTSTRVSIEPGISAGRSAY